MISRELNFSRSELFGNNDVALIIDGSNMFLRNCHIPEFEMKTNRSGQKSGAIYGTLKSILSDTKIWRPKSIYFVIDRNGSVRRKELFKEYKANRGGGLLSSVDGAEDREEREARQRQLDILQEIIPCLKIRWCAIPDFEADDVIAALTTVIPYSVVSSMDTDFIQLHNGVTTVVYDPRKKKIRTAEEFGTVGPAYAILKSVVGDKHTDNINGINGIGWKTIIKWCGNNYPSTMEELKSLAEANSSDRVSKLILDQWALVERNYQLICLSPDITQIYPYLLSKINSWKEAPPTFSLPTVLKYAASENIDQSVVMELLSVMSNFLK